MAEKHDFLGDFYFLCSMKRIFASILFVFIAFAVNAQTIVDEHPAVALGAEFPAGNYSGITRIGENRYAVVDDKAPTDGFYVWQIDIDSLTGRILRVQNLGFRHQDLPNRDAEGCAFLPERQTVVVSGEADNGLVEYTLEGNVRSRLTTNLLPGSGANAGLEALTYDALHQRLWTMEEGGGKQQVRVIGLNTDGQQEVSGHYLMDAPSTSKKSGQHVYGVSAICALSDEAGTLLVLEREAYIPKNKVGAWCKVKIYAVPSAALSVASCDKDEARLLWKTTTRMNLLQQNFANYEGMCLGPKLADGRQTLLLVSDSQNRYAGFLKDYLKVLILNE